MTQKIRWRNGFVGLIAVVALTTLSWGCCSTHCNDWCESKCETIMKADHWLVIHDNVGREEDDEGLPIGCKPIDGECGVAFMPHCLHAKEGETIGFFNYSKSAVTIKHFLTLNAPNPFELAAGEKAVFKVNVSDRSVLFEIASGGVTADHGGPDMIVEP